MCELLLKGKPLLLLPIQLEQSLVAKRVTEIGAGVVVDWENPRRDFRAAIGQIINNADFATRAKEFAQRYAGLTCEATVSRIADDCEAIARQDRKY
jgi:UDP:flavonoid glycosyltransferase YjiC (YdhE family)